MSTDIEEITTALAEFDAVEAGLAELRRRFGGVVYDVTTTAGINDAKSARAIIREPRHTVEKVRKEAKAPPLALGKKIDADAKRITAAILEIEEPIDQQIKAEEQRKEAEKQAAIEAEMQRVAEIKRGIEALKVPVNMTARDGVETIRLAITMRNAADCTSRIYGEFADEAELVRTAAIKELEIMRDAAAEYEQEQARIKAEREELEKLKAEQAERDRVERERLAAERAEIEAAQKAERDRLAKERAEAEAAARAERAKMEAERRAIEEAQRAHEAELARAEAERNEKERREREAAEREEAAMRDAKALADREASRPTDVELARAIADYFHVSFNAAARWLDTYGEGAA